MIRTTNTLAPMLFGFSIAAAACGGADETVPPPAPIVESTATAPAETASTRAPAGEAASPAAPADARPSENVAETTTEAPRTNDDADPDDGADPDDDDGASCVTSISCINGACMCSSGKVRGTSCDGAGNGPGSCSVMCRSCD